MFAGWIETARGPVFACYHPPAGADPRDVAILFCDPFGSDRMNLHLCYRALALELAASGFPVLRVDYWGTCDSAGYAREPGQVASWLATLDEAADWLRRASGRDALGCFGARLGGTIAATFAAGRSDVRSLALWEAHRTGAAFVRELRAFQAMRGAATPAVRPSDWQEGDQEAIGFLLTRETVAEIGKLAIDARGCRSVRAAVVFERESAGAKDSIASSFEDAGVAVARRHEVDFDVARFEEERVRPSRRLVEQLASWWQETHPPARSAPPGIDPAALATQVVLRNRRGSEVREEWVRFGADAGLVGIATRPIGASRGPGVILVNGGVNHRPGINRNYAEWARSWAEQGVLTLRMDIRGLGDSPASSPDDVARLYREETRADVEAAVALLAERYGVADPICGGLCAGGTQAFAAALHDPRIAGLFLLNPLRFEARRDADSRGRTDLEFAPLRHYARSLLEPRRWKRLWSRDDGVVPIARSVVSRLARKVVAPARSLLARVRGAAAPPATPLAAGFVSLEDRGCRVLVVFDTGEAIRHRLEEELAHDRARLESRGRFRVQIVEHADHIFLPLASQEQVGRLLGSWIVQHASRAGLLFLMLVEVALQQA